MGIYISCFPIKLGSLQVFRFSSVDTKIVFWNYTLKNKWETIKTVYRLLEENESRFQAIHRIKKKRRKQKIYLFNSKTKVIEKGKCGVECESSLWLHFKQMVKVRRNPSNILLLVAECLWLGIRKRKCNHSPTWLLAHTVVAMVQMSMIDFQLDEFTHKVKNSLHNRIYTLSTFTMKIKEKIDRLRGGRRENWWKRERL